MIERSLASSGAFTLGTVDTVTRIQTERIAELGRTKEKRFVVYDDERRETLGTQARRSLDQLRERFDRVEFYGISDQQWCVRVVRVVRVNGLPAPLPLAAIGKSLQHAAERLWRMSTFYEQDSPAGRS